MRDIKYRNKGQMDGSETGNIWLLMPVRSLILLINIFMSYFTAASSMDLKYTNSRLKESYNKNLGEKLLSFTLTLICLHNKHKQGRETYREMT